MNIKLLTLFFLFAPIPICLATASDKQTISIDFHQYDLRDALLSIAKSANVDIVLSQAVKGEITLHIKKKPWQETFDLILRTHGLIKQVVNKTLYVFPPSEYSHYLMSVPMKSQSIPLLHTKAQTLQKRLNDKNSPLSAHGKIYANEHTNTLWIKDHEDIIPQILSFIRMLDQPTKQIAIEARMVLLTQGSSQDLGAKLGLDLTPNAHLITKLINHQLLDLELAALEHEGLSRTIARPHLVTTNQQTALIESGEDLPFEERSKQGHTSLVFKKAVLSLSVTPKISESDHITLDLDISQNTRGKPLPLHSGSLPAISTQHLTTQINIRDGETVILGGIYKYEYDLSASQVPFLSKLPIIGSLFQLSEQSESRQELVIFVTPTIM